MDPRIWTKLGLMKETGTSSGSRRKPKITRGKNLGKNMGSIKEPTSDIDTRLTVAKAIIDGSHQFAGTISCGRELLGPAKNLLIIPDSVITLRSRFFSEFLLRSRSSH